MKTLYARPTRKLARRMRRSLWTLEMSKAFSGNPDRPDFLVAVANVNTMGTLESVPGSSLSRSRSLRDHKGLPPPTDEVKFAEEMHRLIKGFPPIARRRPVS